MRALTSVWERFRLTSFTFFVLRLWDARIKRRVREMAAEFPHVDFTSVDTIPLVAHVQSPNILAYEVYDLASGIEEADESFDLVHVKNTMPKVRLHA